jgi:hypothetical protein
MYSNQLQTAMLSAPVPSEKKRHFKGVFAINQLPKLDGEPFALIVNTQPDTEGEHWIALYKAAWGEEIQLFCSYASFDFLPHSVMKFIHVFVQGNSVCYNLHRLQSLCSAACGYYCIAFLIARMNRVSFERFLNLFTIDSENDSRVVNYVNRVCLVWPPLTKRQKKQIDADVMRCKKSLL